MKILVLGSGAREHAIIGRLLADSEPHDIVCSPGNAGIAQSVPVVNFGPIDDPAAVADWLRASSRLDLDLVVIGPEAPLVAGVADAVRALGIPVFGPGHDAAQLEGSKTFAKDVMAAASVPTGGAVLARTLDVVHDAMEQFGAPYVIKADGLAAGKGVIVTSDPEAALAHAEAFIDGGVLIEQFLSGPEVSLFFLSDGTRVAPLSPAQDFKRALDNDEGPNTGGMGAYSPLPWLPADFVESVQKTIAQPTVDQLRAQGTPFVGLLYCGLIVTDDGVKVIEFNARFGDPETQVVLPRLRGEFGRLLLAAAEGRLDSVPAPAFDNDAAVSVVLASEGYPEHPVTGRVLTGLADASSVPGVHIDHAATQLDEGGQLIATGGRVLSVVAVADTLAEARARAYDAIELIDLPGGHFRHDIAAKVATL